MPLETTTPTVDLSTRTPAIGLAVCMQALPYTVQAKPVTSPVSLMTTRQGPDNSARCMLGIQLHTRLNSSPSPLLTAAESLVQQWHQDCSGPSCNCVTQVSCRVSWGQHRCYKSSSRGAVSPWLLTPVTDCVDLNHDHKHCPRLPRASAAKPSPAAAAAWQSPHSAPPAAPAALQSAAP